MYHWRQTRIQMTLRSAGLMALLVFGTSASAQVNTTAPVAEDSGVATVEQEGFSGGVSLNGTYFDVRHQANSGVGYQRGFTQFGAFAPIWGSPDWFVAPNARLTLTDDLMTGGNVGLVARRYSERFDRIFGANAYYDFDQSTNNNRYSQVGFGAESLGRFFDVRANGYVPTNTDSNFLRATGLSPNLVFFENRLGFIGTQLTEQALTGGDAEIGAPLAPDMPWLRGYAGGYMYRQNDGTTTTGFRGRVEGWVTNDLSLGAMVTTDSLFGTNVNFMVDWRFAGFQPTRYFPNWTTRDRMLMPVNRQWRVSAAEINEQVNVAADNPRKITAGDADTRYFVVWVDPNSTAATPGTGTYEDPFHTMPTAVPGQTDLVMVLRGDTTAGAPATSSITLPDFARMLGQGREHLAQASATFGAFSQTTLPGGALLPDARFSNTGLYPFLTNPAGSIVTAGNHNEVASFVMSGAAGNAIFGTNTSGFNFNHLEIRDNNGGIALTAAQGSQPLGVSMLDGQTILGGRIADINNNAVVGGGYTNPNGLGNNGFAGVSVTTGIAALDLELTNVSMNATASAQDYGIRLVSGMGRLGVNMTNISTSGIDALSGGNAIAGVSIEQNTGRIDATIDTLTTSFNDGIGLQLLTGSLRPMNVTGTNVVANSNVLDNLRIADNPAVVLPHNSTFIAGFTNSTFDGSTTGSGIALGMTDGDKTLTLNSVSASGNAVMGVNLLTTGALSKSLTFTADALNASTNTGTNLNIAVNDTAFAGLVSSVAGNSVFDDSVAGSGIVLTATGGTASLNLNTLASTNSFFARNNFADGLQINALGGAQIGNAANVIFDGVNVHNSTLTGNGGMAINQFVAGGSHLEVFVDPTDLSDSRLHSSRFEVLGGSTFVALYDQTTLNNSGQVGTALEASAVGGRGRGIFGLVDGAGSVANVTVTNSSIVGSADDGVYLGTTNASVANLTLTNVNVQNSGQVLALSTSGVDLSGASGSTINLTLNGNLNGNTVLNNTVAGGPADFGLNVTSTGVGTNVNVTSTDTNFDNAGMNAVQSVISMGGTATLNFTGATGTNAGDGLNVVVNAGSVFNACLIDTHFDGFSGAGLNITTTGIGAESNIHMEDSSANGNLLGGLVALVNGGGQLNLRTINTTFNGNGTDAGLSDGVFVRADGAGSTALLLFNTTMANDNLGDQSVAVHRGNGFNFEADNGAYMTARLDTITATGNDGYGVRLDAQNAGTNAFLIPEGVNTISGNGLGSYSVNYNNTASAIVALNGSFNSLAGDGVNVTINNVGTALVSVTGNGTTDTINGNGGDGIDISISNAEQAGIHIAGYTSISSNTGGDGIHITLTNIVDDPLTLLIAPAAAVEILGPMDVSGNSDDGVDITLNNVVLGTVVPPAGVNPLFVVALGVNDPLNDCLPEPTTLSLNTLVAVPASNGILVDQLNINRVGAPAPNQDGISIVSTNVTGTGDIQLTNNTINNFDHGIQAQFNSAASFGALVVNGTTVTNSASNGIDVVLNATTTGGFDISMDSTSVDNSGLRGVSISGAGALGDVNLTNVTATDSAGGAGIAIDLTASTINSITIDGQGTSNVTNSNGDGILVSLLGATNVSSHILLNGNTIDDSGTDGMRLNLNGATGGFDVTKINNNISDSGGMGINLTAVGATLGTITDPSTVTNSQGDGVHIDLTNATIVSLLVDQFTISNSGLSGVGDGLEIILDGTTSGPITVSATDVTNSSGRGVWIHGTNGTGNLNLGDVTLTDVTSTSTNNSEGVFLDFSTGTIGSVNLDNVSATDSAGTGIRVVLGGALTVGPTVSIDGQGTAFSNLNGGDGISLVLSNVTGTPDVNISGYNSLTGVANNGNRGIVLDSNLSDLGAVTVLDNNVRFSGSVGNNTAQGILIDLAGNQVGSLDVGSSTAALTTIDSSFGRGLDVILDGVGSSSVNITNLAVTNSGLGGLLGRGVSVSGLGSATTAIGSVSLTNVSSDSTGAEAGVVVEFNTAGTVVGSINLTGVSANASTLGGILIDLDAITVGSPIALTGGGTSFSTNNGGDGIRINLNNLTASTDVSVTGYNQGVGVAGVDTNVGNGIAVIGSGTTDLGTVTISDNIVNDSSAGDGILFQLASGRSITGPVVLDNNIVDLSSGDGIHIVLDGVIGGANVSTTNSDIDMSGASGINFTAIGATLGTILLDPSTVSNSQLDGVHIDLTSATIAALTVQDFTITNSSLSANGAGDGLEIILDGTDGTPTITVDNTSVSNVAVASLMNRGVSISGTGSLLNSMTLGNVSLTDVTSLGGTVNQGVAVEFSADLAANGVIGTLTLDNVSADSSGTTGILVDLNTVTIGSSIALTGGPNSFSTNNGGDGILVELAGVLGTPDISVTDYSLPNSINNNAGNGIVVLNNGSAVGAVTVSDNMVNNSTAGDGIQVTLNGPIGVVTLDNNTVSNSNNNGINVTLSAVTGSDVTISNSTVTDSFNGSGVQLFTGGASTLNDLRIDNVSATRSNVNGVVAVDFFGSTINSVVLDQIDSDTTTTGVGVVIALFGSTGLTNVAITGGGTVTDSATDGVTIQLFGVTGTPDVTIDGGYNVSQSGDRGISLLTNGSPVNDVTVSNFTVTDSGLTTADAQGVLIDLTNSAVNSLTVGSLTTNTITNSDGRGLDVILDGVTLANSINISDLDVTNSGIGGVFGRGVSVAGMGSAGNPMLLGTNALTGLINLTNVTSTLTGAEEGVAVDLQSAAIGDGSKVGSITLTNVSAFNSFGAGIVTTLSNMTIDPSITIDGQGTALSANNGGDGILVTLNNTVTGIPTALDVSIDNYSSVADNVGRGIALVSNGNSLGAVSVSNNIVSNSTAGQGIQLDLAGSPLVSLLADGNTIANSFNEGLDVILDGVTGTPVVAISNTTVTNSGGRGVSVAGTVAILGDVLLTFVSSDMTTADEGIAVDLDNGTVGSILLNDVRATNSFAGGILVQLDTMSVGPAITIDGQGSGQVTGNGADGIVINLDTLTNTPNLTVSNFAQISANAGDGIIINQINAADVGTVDIANNIITSNTANGVNLVVANSVQGIVSLTENQITVHTGGDGVRVVQPDDLDGSLDFNFLRNTITGNTGGRGVNFDLQYAAPTGNALNAAFENDTISSNGQEGISIVMTGDVAAIVTVNSDAGTANPVSLNFNSDISGNGSFGLLLSTDDTALFDLTIGGTGDQNVFAGNRNAGIGLVMNNGPVAQAGAFSTFDISNVSISNTLLGADLNFTGEGLGVRLNDSSVLRDATLGDAALLNTTLADNAGDGFGFTLVQSAIVSNLTVRNSTFTEAAGTGGTQNNGINLNRRNDSKLTGTVITGSTFTGHVADGINLDLQGGDTNIEAPFGTYIIDVLIGDDAAVTDANTFTGNARGVDILVTADAQLDIGMRLNTFDSNTSDGIRAQTDFFADIVNTGVYGSLWRDNTFTDNGGDGINLSTNRTSTMNITLDDTTINNTPGTGLDGIQLASALNSGITLNVTSTGTGTSITGVGRDGIQVDNTSTGDIVLNLTDVSINNVEQDGIDLNNAASGNVNLTSLRTIAIGPGQTVGTGNGLVATASSVGAITIISTNDIFREFGADGISLNTSGSADLIATFTDMQSRFNGGRGVELINTGNADMNVTLTGTVDPRPTDGMTASARIEENGLNGLFVENNAGALNTDNDITLTLHQTSIRGNGVAAVTPSDDDRNGVWIRAGTSTTGRINATVTSNVMSGNQNIDLLTQSFTATPNPGVASQYTSGAHVIDPVARLGLILGGAGLGNEGDQIDLVRNNSGANPAATYTNADSFKSPGAIFGANTRPRNAQRYATGVFAVAADTVQAAPAPTTTVFAGTGIGEGFGGQGSLVNLNLDLGGSHDITAYNAGTNVFTISPALGAAPAAGTGFTVSGDLISGYGAESSFRSMFASVAAGGNTFTTVLSNFGTNLGVVGGRGPFSVFDETYTWTTDVTPFVSP